jgi:integrative and conjugative element protein (TIGR02256 family)
MFREADAHARLETGGVLLGVTAAGDLWIEAVIGPGPAARHGQTWFVPDAAYQQERVAELYEASGRRVAYLGDWHTHPGATPALSWRDCRTLRRISRTAAARQPHPVMLILGHGQPWLPTLWRYQPARWYQRGTRFREVSLEIVR